MIGYMRREHHRSDLRRHTYRSGKEGRIRNEYSLLSPEPSVGAARAPPLIASQRATALWMNRIQRDPMRLTTGEAQGSGELRFVRYIRNIAVGQEHTFSPGSKVEPGQF